MDFSESILIFFSAAGVLNLWKITVYFWCDIVYNGNRKAKTGKKEAITILLPHHRIG